jgi:GNAT superfamily N-acetyltransferase
MHTMLFKLTTTSLEMIDPRELRPAPDKGVGLEIQQAKVSCPELNRFFYTAVGGDWYWIDRLSWTYDQWYRYLDRPGLQTWIGAVSGTPAGYFELEMQQGGNVEIAYFGLLPQCIGQGLGGRLLTAAIERAWQMGAARVWVHTCSLDHPGALANYRARGFRPYKEEVTEVDLPEQSPGPWPGARRSGPLTFKP